MKKKGTEFEKFLRRCKKNLDDARLDLRKILEYMSILDSEYYANSPERYDFIDSFGELILEIKQFLEAYKHEEKRERD